MQWYKDNFFSSIYKYNDHFNLLKYFQGWLNELDGEYHPETYNVSLTHSVWVRLQGSILQIDNARSMNELSLSIYQFYKLEPQS